MTYEEMCEYIRSNAYERPNGRDFYQDLIDLHQLDERDPQVSRMYSLAWGNGHAHGYLEIFNHFNDLVRVFKS